MLARRAATAFASLARARQLARGVYVGTAPRRPQPPLNPPARPVPCIGPPIKPHAGTVVSGSRTSVEPAASSTRCPTDASPSNHPSTTTGMADSAVLSEPKGSSVSATTSNPAIARVMFSSASDDWATPQAFYDELDAEFGFVLDACSSTSNHKAPHFFALDHPDADRRDGLAGDWTADARTHGGAVWCNPVYGRTIGEWMAKAAATARAGTTVVCLVPARTDTRWFHQHVLAEGAEVRFVRGRLKFGTATTGAPFASLVVIYHAHPSADELLHAGGESDVEEASVLPGQDALALGTGCDAMPDSRASQISASLSSAPSARSVPGSPAKGPSRTAAAAVRSSLCPTPSPLPKQASPGQGSQPAGCGRVLPVLRRMPDRRLHASRRLSPAVSSCATLGRPMLLAGPPSPEVYWSSSSALKTCPLDRGS